MTEQVALRLHNRNPDVLTCIANLSNDEVFTPPELANQMLDLVAAAWADGHNGASIWADPPSDSSTPSPSPASSYARSPRGSPTGSRTRSLISRHESITSSPSRCSASESPASPA